VAQEAGRGKHKISSTALIPSNCKDSQCSTDVGTSRGVGLGLASDTERATIENAQSPFDDIFLHYSQTDTRRVTASIPYIQVSSCIGLCIEFMILSCQNRQGGLHKWSTSKSPTCTRAPSPQESKRHEAGLDGFAKPSSVLVGNP
jgi:hypothetical protein